MHSERLIARTLTLLSVMVLLGGTAAQATEMPADQVVQYLIRETPSDPASPVEYVVTLTLHAKERCSNKVGWQVAEFELREIGVGGAEDMVWVDAQTVVDSNDGLWWVAHVNAETPNLVEFLGSPLLMGLGSAGDSGVPALGYEFKSSAYTSSSPFPITASLDYTFTLADDPPTPPKKKSEDEPVEVPEELDPPAG